MTEVSPTLARMIEALGGARARVDGALGCDRVESTRDAGLSRLRRSCRPSNATCSGSCWSTTSAIRATRRRTRRWRAASLSKFRVDYSQTPAIRRSRSSSRSSPRAADFRPWDNRRGHRPLGGAWRTIRALGGITLRALVATCRKARPTLRLVIFVPYDEPVSEGPGLAIEADPLATASASRRDELTLEQLALASSRTLDERLELRPHDLGCTRCTSSPCAKPQSVPAITFSRPTSRAKRTIRSATRRGCSTVVMWCVMTPGISILPSGASTSPRRATRARGAVGRLDRVGAGVHLEHQIDDALERRVGDVRHVPAAETDVVAHALLGNALQRVIQRVDAQLRPLAIVLRALLHEVVVHVGEHRIVDLQHEPGVDDGPVLLSSASAIANTYPLRSRSTR